MAVKRCLTQFNAVFDNPGALFCSFTCRCYENARCGHAFCAAKVSQAQALSAIFLSLIAADSL